MRIPKIESDIFDCPDFSARGSVARSLDSLKIMCTGVLSIGLVTARTGVDVGYNFEDGTGVGITMKASGNACFSGIVTAYNQFYPPVITTVQRDALTVNAGALIFNTTSTQLEIYNGTTWVGVGAVNNLTISNL